MVRRWRSWLTAARTCSTFEGVVAVLGRPDRPSLAVEVLPFLKRPNHLKVRLRLMHESPKACFNISKVSLPVLPILNQNLMHTLCSSTSAIPPISENRRRMMQYTHKDTCKNQTLPHPTTPLGTLTHKTPPQHTLAGNSWTTSDLRVMSIVLGLLDKPSYNVLTFFLRTCFALLIRTCGRIIFHQNSQLMGFDISALMCTATYYCVMY